MAISTPTPEEARAALASVDETRLKVADFGNCPFWRHAAFGGVMGLLITGVGFPLPWQTASLVLAMAAVVWIKRWDEKTYGVFVNGFRAGKTLPASILLLATMLGLIWLQFDLRDRGAATWVPFAVGFVAFLIGTGASMIWSRIYRSEMEARA